MRFRNVILPCPPGCENSTMFSQSKHTKPSWSSRALPAIRIVPQQWQSSPKTCGKRNIYHNWKTNCQTNSSFKVFMSPGSVRCPWSMRSRECHKDLRSLGSFKFMFGRFGGKSCRNTHVRQTLMSSPFMAGRMSGWVKRGLATFTRRMLCSTLSHSSSRLGESAFR